MGNPGSEYENTRHNIGFSIVDAVAEERNITLSEGKGEYIIGSEQAEKKKIILVKPLTFMNNSGTAVKEVLEHLNLDERNLLVIVDDFNLPLGKIRIREHGSSGGHNGLYSIIYHLNSDNFPRLRCGIAGESMPKDKSKIPDFVLSTFTNDERKIVKQLILTARDAAITAGMQDLQTVFKSFNNIQV